MARIVERFLVPIPPATAFAYIADFTNTQHWDPQITTAVREDAGPLRVGSAFRVSLLLGPGSRTVPLVYTITELSPGEQVVLETSGWWYRGRDDVRIRPADDGSEVVWDATFALRGPFLLLEPLLAVGFRRTARKAVAGLRSALTGLPGRKDDR
jgi:hypothetical protein